MVRKGGTSGEGPAVPSEKEKPDREKSWEGDGQGVGRAFIWRNRPSEKSFQPPSPSTCSARLRACVRIRVPSEPRPLPLPYPSDGHRCTSSCKWQSDSRLSRSPIGHCSGGCCTSGQC